VAHFDANISAQAQRMIHHSYHDGIGEILGWGQLRSFYGVGRLTDQIELALFYDAKLDIAAMERTMATRNGRCTC
jgi:hypothetical protein